MVQRVEWMAPIDYWILEFFQEHDIKATPQVVAANIDYDNQYTGKRLNRMAEAGLFEKDEPGLFSLTDRGRAFLAGDLDADDLDADDLDE
ncbi:winged helix-turn-helix domain-containing protein [Halocalculus aciditolerans]|nr:winged helix-turn-helix domain-containing protein [Halocalculus aciditolerans]